MKTKLFFTLILAGLSRVAIACDACARQQPAITRDLTHGTGPGSNWDWVIVAAIAGITLATLIFSVKYLVRPGEKSPGHIKNAFLSQNHE